MVIFTPNERDFYVTNTGIGPGTADITSKEWNLAAITTRVLFGWENDADFDDLFGEFPPDLLEAVRFSMTYQVNGKTVDQYMEEDTPFNFLHACLMDMEKAKVLPVCKYWGSFDDFITVLTARCYTWQPRVIDGVIQYIPQEARECIRIASA